MDRRDFISGASASGILLLNARTAFGYEANSAVRLGLLGCGNRGTSVATSFAKNTSARIVALADLFPDQLAAGKAHFDEVNRSLGVPGIDEKLMFHGYRACEELAASPSVDAIQISTPPWFHVQHLEAVVNSGKHAYCEKPLGVDVAQTQHALEIGKRAEGRLSLDVGFQVRSAPPIAEVVRRIHGATSGGWQPSPRTTLHRTQSATPGPGGRPMSSGCATGCGIECSPVTFWSSRISM